MRYVLKSKLNIIIKSVIIFIVAIFLENQTNNVVLNAQNSNLNKQLSLSSFAVVDITNDEYKVPDSEKEQVKQEEAVQEEPKNLINAKLTGYVFNCPSCSGKLACDSSINLSNGNVNYNDTFAKYEIDYAIVEDKEIINTYISADENYEKVFDDETFSIYIKK